MVLGTSRVTGTSYLARVARQPAIFHCVIVGTLTRQRQTPRESERARPGLANQDAAPELRMKLTGHKTEAGHHGYTHHELENPAPPWKMSRRATELFDGNLTPVPFDPHAVMAAPTPATMHPDCIRMRSRCPAAYDPDPMPAPFPRSRNPEPNRQRAGCNGYDFDLRRRWGFVRHHHLTARRRRRDDGRLAFINHTTGQHWQADGHQQQFCQD